MRFISANLEAFDLTAENVHVVTPAGGVSEALFDLFFELLDLSILQIPFENFLVQQNPFSNLEIFENAPKAAVDELYGATGCESFECLKKDASAGELLSVDQKQFRLTSSWAKQIDRLFTFRAKYKFTFLNQYVNYDFGNFEGTVSRFLENTRQNLYFIKNSGKKFKFIFYIIYFL